MIQSPDQAKLGGYASLAELRDAFPILQTTVHGHPLTYLDNAATNQKPQQVLDAIDATYTEFNANVHRGVHWLSEQATHRYESTREKAQHLLSASQPHEIIFTKGTTEGINLVASSFGQQVQPGDEIIVSELEHHSNIVPWQMLCERTGATLVKWPMTSNGDLQLETLEQLLSTKTKLVAVTHVSNALGTVNPVRDIAQMAHAVGALVLVDGAQSVAHMPIDVIDLDCDFFVCSGHKMYGPTGTGLLYGKENILNALPPYHGGGDMIRKVSFDGTTYAELPAKFEAGTPNYVGVIGLGAAIDFIQTLGFEWLQHHEQELLQYTHESLSKIPGLNIVAQPARQCGAISFVMDGIHPHDIATLLDQKGVAIRAGHHCTQPIMQALGLPATARVSLASYNTHEDIDVLCKGLETVHRLFASE